MEIHSKEELKKRLKAKFPYQEVKFTLNESYGPREFFYKILYWNQNKELEYKYTLLFKSWWNPQSKSFKTKNKVLEYLFRVIDESSFYKNKKENKKEEKKEIKKNTLDLDNFDLEEEKEKCLNCGSTNLTIVRKGDERGYTHKVQKCLDCGYEITV